MDDLLREFLTETSESIGQLDVELVRLEQSPDDPELIGSIFRLVHTIKGTCGFLGLPRLEKIAHASENVLGQFRDRTLDVTPEAVTAILESLDVIKGLLAALEETGAEPDGNDNPLIARLNAICEGRAAAAPAPAPAPADHTVAEPGSLYERVGGDAAVEAAVNALYNKILADPALNHFFAGVDMARQRMMMTAFMATALNAPGANAATDLTAAHARLVAGGLNGDHFDRVAGHLAAVLAELGVAPAAAAEVLAIVGGTRDAVLGRAGSAAPAAVVEAAAVAEVVEAPRAEEHRPDESRPDEAPGKAADDGAKGEARDSGVAHQTIRVGVDLLEHLMTQVSELVLTRNQLLQLARSMGDSEFTVPLERLSHITSDLQEGVMKTRMQPIGNAWSKLPRIVRDLSRDLGKKIELKMLGAETELDRQVLELIKDPLTHMVRNSADHGLEVPDDRRRANKPEVGTITLNAYHEGGHIIIDVSDDGRGINVEKVRAKVAASGLASEADVAAMSDSQVQQFIFRAGLSTAQAVTSVSGRGVGMDVVKSNIEKIGGTIELSSVFGKGTRFVIKIPLTLAIVSALIVECAGERFAVPQISVVELVRTATNSEHRIELINDAPVLRLRNRLLPLVSLAHALDMREDADTDWAHAELFIIVSQVGTYRFGIIVDRVFDTEEIVVKPVSPILRDIPMFSGNTILGDGGVVMILDPNGVAAATGETSRSADAAESQVQARVVDGQEAISMLVFRAGASDPKAVPLSLVARLEEIDPGAVEQFDGRPVIQYRGQLMPLVQVSPAQQLREGGRQPVVVFADRDRSMGLLVDEIVDIVEARMKIELRSGTPGLIGSAVIAGKATDVVDAGHYLAQAVNDWFGAERQTAFGQAERARRVLLVDDSPFFRNLLQPLLTAAGYEVTAAEDAKGALQMRESGAEFDLIISDIEMPGMNGFEFAKACKSGDRWRDVPMVALTSHAAPDDLARGREVGFDDYVAKFDREAILTAIHSTLANLGEAA